MSVSDDATCATLPPPRAVRTRPSRPAAVARPASSATLSKRRRTRGRLEEHTSELQSLMRISYAVFCLKKKKNTTDNTHQQLRTKRDDVSVTRIAEQSTR